MSLLVFFIFICVALATLLAIREIERTSHASLRDFMATPDEVDGKKDFSVENGAAQNKDQHQRVRGSEVFVGGLQKDVTEENVRELFSDCGEIAEVRMMRDQNGVLKGYCFIRFTTRGAAFKAQKAKTGIIFHGKKIGVNAPTEQDTLFLGNLRKDWSAEEIEKMVREAFQDVYSVVLAMSTTTGESPSKKQQNRGFAFVHFPTHAAAARAHRIATRPEFLLGGKWRPVVDWAESEPEPDPDEMAKVTTAFVGNLPDSVTEDFLQGLFHPFGKIDRVAISKKGSTPVGFIHFVQRSELEAAIKELDSKLVDGPGKGLKFKLQVSVAKPVDKSRKRNRDETQNTATANVPAHGKVAGIVPGLGFTDHNLAMNPHVLFPFAVPEVYDQYDLAVASLKPAIADRLTHLFRQGFASRQEVDMLVLQALKELPEAAAIKALDQFGASKFSDPLRKSAYLTGLIDMARREVKENAGGLPASRLSGIDQLSAPFAGVDTDLSRYDPYGSLATAGLYAPYSVGVGAETLFPRIPTAFGEPFNLPGIASYLTSGSMGTVGGSQEANATERRTVKFDPFTGEPYKFDPFTGQPVQSSGLSSSYVGGKFL